jgi:NAD(P)-dependent dehydrogenase (short-subunit alcohol dehydrogenase family)
MGLAAAQQLATRRYEVVISGRSEASVEKALGLIPGERQGYRLDFADPASVKAFFDQVGFHDHLALVGSGRAAWGPFGELTTDALNIAFREKFFGFFLCAQAALPSIRRDGSILFTTGGASRSAIPGTTGVAAVNGAIQAMAFTMAKELAPLRVNILSPGLVDTPAYDGMTSEQKAAFFGQMGGTLPVGRVGTAEELGQAVAFLIGCSFASGVVLDVDGGGRLH